MASRRIASRFGLFREFFRFLWRERLWWMIPLVVTLLLVGFLVIVSMNSAVAPFVYTLF